MSIYGRNDIDYWCQDKLVKMKKYLNSSKLVDQSKDISDWYGRFMETANNNEQQRGTWLTSDFTKFKDKNMFYTELHNWYDGGGGARYRSSLQWNDVDCNRGDKSGRWRLRSDERYLCHENGHDADLGSNGQGNVRYETMTYLRNNVTDILGGKSFPYSFQFLYWRRRV